MAFKLEKFNVLAIFSLVCLTAAVLKSVNVAAVDPVQMCPIHFSTVLKRIGSCDSIKCTSSLTERTCSDIGAVYEEGAQLCGCCPGCVKYGNGSGYLEKCDAIDGLAPEYDPGCKSLECPIIANRCKPGLRCQNGLCQPDLLTNSCQNHCFIKKAVLEYENAFYQSKPRRHLPDCTKDGYFKPKQCKGTRNQGDCYCVDECGKRIFGRELYERADNQTCGCSIHVHNLRIKQNRLATFHCTDNGDYEPLQCDSDSGLCYCVDPITGATTGAVMPEHQWKNLPCYDPLNPSNAVDGQYLRVCESEWVAGQKITREAALHGLQYTIRPLTCDFDGGYGPIWWDTAANSERCVHKGSSQIAGHFRVFAEKPPMDCKCARDSVYYPVQGLPFYTECASEGRNPRGSYKSYYVAGSIAYCVDEDGHRYGGPVPSEFQCCLEDSTCKDGQCANVGGQYPYQDCLDYYLGRSDEFNNYTLQYAK